MVVLMVITQYLKFIEKMSHIYTLQKVRISVNMCIIIIYRVESVKEQTA
jgi:hypothetical protein